MSGSSSTSTHAPSVVGRIYDGQPLDVALTADTLLIAEGRNVARLDPDTGAVLGVDAYSPYADAPRALEYNPLTGTVYVATSSLVYAIPATGLRRTYVYRGTGAVEDIKVIAADHKVVVWASHELVVLDDSAAGLTRVSSVDAPPEISFARRLQQSNVDGVELAFAIGDLANGTSRATRGLAMFDLDRANAYATPVLKSVWDARTVSNGQATVLDVAVYPNFAGNQDVAFVAGGIGGQLLRLDITNPAAPVYLDQTVLQAGAPISHVILEPDLGRLLVVGFNLLFVVDPHTAATLGSSNPGFVTGGARDLALWQQGAQKTLWSATAHNQPFVIQGNDLTANTPQALHQVWWVSSSDGAVAAPQWNSIYLPTFGGVGRYAVTDLAHPLRVANGHAPARDGINTEHIDIMYPVVGDTTHAELVVAYGGGGFQTFAVSAAQPNPATPVEHLRTPTGWMAGQVYENDATFYQHGGVNYVLNNVTHLVTGQSALMIYNTQADTWIDVINPNTHGTTNTTFSVQVIGTHALVSMARFGFFVVDLGQLPTSATFTTEVPVHVPAGDGAIGLAVNPEGTLIFASAAFGGLVSFAFDDATGTVTGPLSTLTDPSIGGSTSRARYNPLSHRVYSATNDGRIHEFDVSDSTNLVHLSYWDCGTTDEMQDARVYDFGSGPRILAVTNTQGFAILDPDDGL